MKNILNNIEVSRTEPLYGAVTGNTEHYGYFVAAQKTGEGLYSITYNGNTIVMDSGWYAPSMNGDDTFEKIELLEEMDFYGYRVRDNNLFHGWACSSSTHPDSACYVQRSHNGDGTRSMTYFPGPSTGSSNGIKVFGGSILMYYFDFKEYGGNRGYVSEPVPGVAYNKPNVYYNNPVGVHRYTIHLKYIDLNDFKNGDGELFSDSTPVTSFTSTYEYLCKELFYGVEGVDQFDYFDVFDMKGNEMLYVNVVDAVNLYKVPGGIDEIVVVLVVNKEQGQELA